MANPYAVKIKDANNVIRLEGVADFYVAGNTPLDPTLPAVINAAALPTADPHVVGQVWSNAGVLTVSAG